MAETAEQAIVNDDIRKQRATETLNPVALEATFCAAFAQRFGDQPGAMFPAWTKADAGRVKSGFVKRWKGTPQQAHDFIRWTVKNWQDVMYVAFSWMRKQKPPEFPILYFFLRHQETFLTEFGRDKTERWIKSMKDGEAKEFTRLTVKERMSPEAARIKIAEDRTLLKVREENRKTKEEMNAKLHKLQLMQQKIDYPNRGIHRGLEHVKLGPEDEARIEKARAVRRIPHPSSANARDATYQKEKEDLARWHEETGIPPLGPHDPIPDLVALMGEWSEEWR